MSPRWTVTPSWKRARPPGFIAPCLPALVDHVPAGPGWLHELKWDGYRIIARKEGSGVKLWSRAGRGWHGAFPGIAAGHCGLADDEPDPRRRGRRAARGRLGRLLRAAVAESLAPRRA